jgi:hypothetical protein
MIAVSFLILVAVACLYLLADLAVLWQACKPPCHACPHWNRCLSRRISRIKPYRNTELCILRWN